MPQQDPAQPRLDVVAERISEPEDMSIETYTTDKQKHGWNKAEQDVQGLWDNYRGVSLLLF